MYDIVISGARLAGEDGLWDVGIKNEKIAFLVPAGSSEPAREQIKADKRVLFPGIIDAHVHARDPGYTYKESFGSASMAAANGGITTMLAMPNSNPPLTNAASIHYAARHLEGQNLIDIRLVGGALAAAPGWISSAAQAGVIALDVFDDAFSYGTQTWIALFQEAKKTGLPLCFYLMDSALEHLRADMLDAAEAEETEKILGTTNGETEAMSIARIFPMAAYFHVPVVIRMVSTADAVKMLRYMRKLYPEARVYAEVCVHYLFLTSDTLKKQGSVAHIHPPLRSSRDVDGLWEGVRDGTIDYISSDHAPHAENEKKRTSIAESASGITGLETMLSLLLHACHEGKLGFSDIQRLCCENPAKIYGLFGRKGHICVGCDADLVLADPEEEWIVRQKELFTKGAAGPFEGWRLRGRPQITISRGRKVMSR